MSYRTSTGLLLSCALFSCEDVGERTGVGQARQSVTNVDRLHHPMPEAEEQFGSVVALDHHRLVVGVHLRDQLGADAGGLVVFERAGGTWNAGIALAGTDTVAGDWFGAAADIDGDTIVAGAKRRDSSSLPDSGAAYVFQHDGASWSEQATIVPTDVAGDDEFGQSVGISGDTIVASSLDGDGPFVDSGTAHIYVRNGTSWTFQQKLEPDSSTTNPQFGIAVAIDGDTIVVGARLDSDGRGSEAGAAYVFVRNGTTWSQQAKLQADNLTADDWFGISVALDGDVVVVGARTGDGGSGILTGTAHVFERSGTTWQQTAQLVPMGLAAGDWFGERVAVDGDRVVASARMAEVGGAIDAGAAWLFGRDGPGWTERAMLTVTDPVDRDQLNIVSVSGDTVAIGVPRDDTAAGTETGTVALFVVRELGEACASDDECVSGSCRDGVCCDDDCGGGATGDCNACSVALGAPADGTCSPVADQTPCDDGTCRAGACVAGIGGAGGIAGNAGMGGGAGEARAGAGGVASGGAGPAEGGGGTIVSAGAGGEGGGAGSTDPIQLGGTPGGSGDSSCGCRVGPEPVSYRWLLASLVAVAMAARRRRRQSGRSMMASTSG